MKKVSIYNVAFKFNYVHNGVMDDYEDTDNLNVVADDGEEAIKIAKKELFKLSTNLIENEENGGKKEKVKITFANIKCVGLELLAEA